MEVYHEYKTVYNLIPKRNYLNSTITQKTAMWVNSWRHSHLFTETADLLTVRTQILLILRVLLLQSIQLQQVQRNAFRNILWSSKNIHIIGQGQPGAGTNKYVKFCTKLTRDLHNILLSHVFRQHRNRLFLQSAKKNRNCRCMVKTICRFKNRNVKFHTFVQAFTRIIQ